MSDHITYERLIESPVGAIRAIALGDALRAVVWPNQTHEDYGLSEPITAGAHAVLDVFEAQLREYFSGERREFDLPLVAPGTEFQQLAWDMLRKIPYGETWTYGQQAKAMGKPSAVRAVGGANGRNPLSIVVPCHRVIGANGSLTGFGGGIETKRYLLGHERKHLGFSLQLTS